MRCCDGMEWGSMGTQRVTQSPIWWVRWGEASKLSSEKGVGVKQVCVEGNRENSKLERAWHVWATGSDPFQWFQHYVFGHRVPSALHSAWHVRVWTKWVLDERFWKKTGWQDGRKEGRKEGEREAEREGGRKCFPHHLWDSCQIFLFFLFFFFVMKIYLCNIEPHIPKFKSVPLFRQDSRC